MKRRFARWSLILSILTFCFLNSNAQNVTNEGKEFWMAFTEMRDATAASYYIQISSKHNASGIVEIPGTNFSVNWNVVANQITKVTIPPGDAFNNISDAKVDKGIHISADSNIVVYANTAHQYRSEATLVLPNSALGNEYRVSSYPTQGIYQSSFIVVAPGDSVCVIITPTATTEGGQLANTPDTICLDSSEVYQVQAQANTTNDLTGSLVKTLDPNDKVAVYNGHTWAYTFCNGNKDPLFEVSYPVNSLGKEYIALPSVSRTIDMFRAVARENATDIFVDNVFQVTLNAGQFYEDTFSIPTYVTGSKPISVAQYQVTGQCDNAPVGDPAVVILNANEQMYLDTVTFFAVEEFDIDSNYVNIITRTPDTATMFFNTNPIANWTVFTHDTNYSHTSFRVDTGFHNLTTTSCGFLSYIYGMGFAESYFYAAGVRLNDLNDSLSFVNISTGGNKHCVIDSIQFFANLSGGNPLSFEWHFGDGDTSDLQNPIHLYPDSGEYVVKLYVEYLCFTDSIIDTIEILPQPIVDLGLDTFICDPHATLTLYAGNPGFDYLWSPGGQTTDSIVVSQNGNYSVVVDIGGGVCSDQDDIVVTFAEEPVNTAFTIEQSVCEGEPVHFKSTSDSLPNSWTWDFDDGTGGLSNDEEHAYTTEGTYNYSLVLEYDCHEDTLYGTVAVFKQPSVDLGPDSVFCTPAVFELDARNNSGFSHLWSTGENSQKIKVDESGTYSVIVSSTHCSAEDEITVDIPVEGIIPNVFTPNRDGFNDVFEVGVYDRCGVGDLLIQNRWGRKVFETGDPLNNFWGGLMPDGTEAKDGVYYWILTDTKGTRTGYVTLIR